MCVRFLRPEQLAELMQVVDDLSVSAFRVSPEELSGRSGGEAAPGATAALVGMGRILCEGCWGFGRWDGKGLVFNARSESLMSSPMWSPCVRRGRCVVPARGYFEWSHLEAGRGQKYRIRRQDGGMLYMAGLARRQGGKPLEFTVVTQPAVAEIASMHDRMPLLLDGTGIDAWLDGALSPADCLVKNGRVEVTAEKEP